MKGQLRVDALYAYLVVDDDGTEGVPAQIVSGGLPMPMVGADMERMDSLRPAASQIAKQLHKPVELVCFSARQHRAWIGRAPLRPVPPPPDPQRVPFRSFDQPEMVSAQDIIRADGIVVAATVLDGRPAVVIVYTVPTDDGGRRELTVAVTGQQAADLVPLTASAWEAAKAALS